MTADLLVVVLPADSDLMREAINTASVADLSGLLQHYDDTDDVWAPLRSVAGASSVYELPHESWQATIAGLLSRHPAAADGVRRYLLDAVDDHPGCAGVQLRVRGIDFVVAGGTSFGDDAYEGFAGHRVLSVFLSIVGKGVPEEVDDAVG